VDRPATCHLKRQAENERSGNGELTISEEVRERMQSAYRQRVLKAARRLIGRAKDFLELGDLVSVGSLALDKAITQFDVNRGTKFEVFASSRIRFAMMKEIERVSCPEVSFSSYEATIEGGSEFIDSVPEKEVSETGMAERLIDKHFWSECFEECLTIRERKIVRSIIWDRMTVEEVAEELSMARPWVSEIYQKALAKLKEYLTEHGFDHNTIIDK
jgi:RNA polymerase sigma factor (sigma-70 family)